jgi:hypothetical protein
MRPRDAGLILAGLNKHQSIEILMASTSLRIFPRSMLFVSGENADRFPKAMGAGADLVCIDLEDAVHADRKQSARDNVIGWLGTNRSSRGPPIALRINGLRTLDGLRDVLALHDSKVRLDWLLVPKVEDAADLHLLHAWAGDCYERLTALIETPGGVENALTIAQSGGKLAALMLGGADLTVALGAQFDWDGLLHARGRLVNAAKAAGLQAWDVPFIDLNRPDDLSDETRKVPVKSCGGAEGCHVTATLDDGGILTYELDQRNKRVAFVCTKCHLAFGSRPGPASHPCASPTPAKRVWERRRWWPSFRRFRRDA